MRSPRALAIAPEPRYYRLAPPFEGMVEGLRLHGVEVEVRPVGPDVWAPNDFLLVNGWIKPGRTHTPVIERQLAEGLPVLVIDAGYVSRKHYWSLGWGGINGRADFRNAGAPGDRWRKVVNRPSVQPWRRKGDHIVIMGQVRGDAALQGMDFDTWLTRTVEELRSLTKRRLVFRPHPKDKAHGADAPLQIDDGDIAGSLAGAWAAVTHNSTSGVDAALAGIPVFADDLGSIAWPIANRMLASIENPATPNRTRWLNELAYAQWTSQEMAEGLPWPRLRKGLP